MQGIDDICASAIEPEQRHAKRGHTAIPCNHIRYGGRALIRDARVRRTPCAAARAQEASISARNASRGRLPMATTAIQRTRAMQRVGLMPGTSVHSNSRSKGARTLKRRGSGVLV